MTVSTGGVRRVRSRRAKVRSVLRVRQGQRWVGDILVDTRKRVWRHADAIPRDVVLKILFAFTRQALPVGATLGQDTGWVYSWQRLPGE